MIPDILPADEETKKLYFKECKSLLDVIHLLKLLINIVKIVIFVV